METSESKILMLVTAIALGSSAGLLGTTAVHAADDVMCPPNLMGSPSSPLEVRDVQIVGPCTIQFVNARDIQGQDLPGDEVPIDEVLIMDSRADSVHLENIAALEIGVFNSVVKGKIQFQGLVADDMGVSDTRLECGDIEVQESLASTITVDQNKLLCGDVEVQNNVAGRDLRVTANTVGGEAQVKKNAAVQDLVIEENRVGDSVQINDNTAGDEFAILDNTVGGDLECEDNDPDPTVAENVVGGEAEGQCSPGGADGDDDDDDDGDDDDD